MGGSGSKPQAAVEDSYAPPPGSVVTSPKHQLHRRESQAFVQERAHLAGPPEHEADQRENRSRLAERTAPHEPLPSGVPRTVKEKVRRRRLLLLVVVVVLLLLPVLGSCCCCC